MQYDSPVSSSALQSDLSASSANLSESTLAAINSLLNLDTIENVGIAGIEGNAVQLPTSGTADIVFGAVEGEQGDQVVVDLAAAEAAGVNAYVLQSDANLVVDLQGQTTAAAADVQVLAAQLAPAAVDTSAIELVVATGNGDDVITVGGDQNTLIDAGDGNDTIITGNGNNTVIAGLGNNNVTTGSGDDTIILSGSNHADIVNAGEGYDVVQLDGSRDDYTVTTGNSFNVNLTGNQTAAISNAEFLSFVNGDEVETIALAHSEAEASALRLFEGLLGRDADQDGAKFFVDQVNQGTTLDVIANQFLNSAEFAGVANGDSINDLYNALLGRDADQDGATLFQNYLATGGSLADVAAFISVSEEAQDRDQSNGDFVRELYTSALGRDADESGLDTYVSALFNGTSRADVAKYIVGSEEAAQKSTGEFIDALYSSALGREADTAGKAFWTAQLDGGLNKADVAISIIGSPEAADHIDNVVVLHGNV
jgi:Ca2+-binding RTX toxin-like protein